MKKIVYSSFSLYSCSATAKPSITNNLEILLINYESSNEIKNLEYPAVMIKTVHTFVTNSTMLAVLEYLQQNKFKDHPHISMKKKQEVKLIQVMRWTPLHSSLVSVRITQMLIALII